MIRTMIIILKIALISLVLDVAYSARAQEIEKTDDTLSSNDQALAELPPLEGEVSLPASRQLSDLGLIQEYYRSTKSFEADFFQRAPDGSMANGTLFVERPGRLRFQYEEAPLLVVSDGETLNLIDQEIGQVTRWPVADTPLRLLVAEMLDLSGLDARIESSPEGADEGVALIARDPERPELGVISVFFEEDEADGLLLRGWSIVDGQGGETLVTIGKTVRNAKLDKKLWTFKDPRGRSKRIRR